MITFLAMANDNRNIMLMLVRLNDGNHDGGSDDDADSDSDANEVDCDLSSVDTSLVQLRLKLLMANFFLGSFHLALVFGLVVNYKGFYVLVLSVDDYVCDPSSKS